LDGSTQGALTLSTGSVYTAGLNTITYLDGSIVNDGTITLIGVRGDDSELSLTGNTTQSGGGNAFVQGNSDTLTNTNNTIQGTGVIGNGSLAVINKSVIDATPIGTSGIS
jgi:hypothetical protein